MAKINRYLDELLDLEKTWNEKKSPVWGISTGYPSIDRITGGFHKGEVTLLGARTSHGKTALGTKIAFNVAEQILTETIQEGHVTGQVLIFSPEMTAPQLLMRQACALAEVSANRIRMGIADEWEREGFHEAIEMIRHLDDIVFLSASGSVDLFDLVSQVEQRHAQGPEVKLVLVDYLQRLSAGGRSGAYDKSSLISTTIKDMANRLDIPILLLSQLNRSPEKRKDKDDPESAYPELTDFRDSGRIEEDADNAWLLWRPNKLTSSPDDDSAQQALLQIAKNRNGSVGATPLWFFPHLALFKDAGIDKVRMDGGVE